MDSENHEIDFCWYAASYCVYPLYAALRSAAFISYIKSLADIHCPPLYLYPGLCVLAQVGALKWLLIPHTKASFQFPIIIKACLQNHDPTPLLSQRPSFLRHDHGFAPGLAPPSKSSVKQSSQWAAAWRSPARRGAALWPAEESCPKLLLSKAQIYPIQRSRNALLNPGQYPF